MSIFGDDSHKKHFKYAIPTGLCFTLLCVLGCASGMEFKDREHGGKWDWADWWWTIAGGAVGQTLQIAIIVGLWLTLN